ncbi:MAG: bifunctional transcriptional activator/DNA repair enzyme AdaA, partial [Acidimicrobiia bacterium]
MARTDATPDPVAAGPATRADDRWYEAARSKDRRFDGAVYLAVTSTGIYCRPSCPARTPLRRHCRFFPTAAAAQSAGFRACKRCRPDAAPGSPAWNQRADVVGRAMQLIADGVVDRSGVTGLAEHLSYGERQLHRLLVSEVGAGPLAIAVAQRAQTARLLIETTTMSITDVAFAAGFSSVRQFNDTIAKVFDATPTQLRVARRGASAAGRGGVEAGAVTVRLALRQPFDAASLFGFLAVRAIPGVESWDGTTYRRSLRLPGGFGLVALRAVGEPCDHIRASFRLESVADLAVAVHRCRRLLDLDADPWTIAEAFSIDPIMAPLIEQQPGLRVPGHVDGAEVAVRAVLGQQVSVAGARTLAARLAEEHGELLPE